MRLNDHHLRLNRAAPLRFSALCLFASSWLAAPSPASAKPAPGRQHIISNDRFCPAEHGCDSRRNRDCNRCDDGNPCTKDTEYRGRCKHAPLEGKRCDDGNACTVRDICDDGVCGGRAVQCSAPDACHTAACNPETGACESSPSSGGSCDDSNGCTLGDTCAEGACVGTPVECTPGTCELGACNPATGSCEYSIAPDGDGCSDGDLCNGKDECLGGACIPSNPLPTTAVVGTSTAPLLVADGNSGDGSRIVAADVTGSMQILNQFVDGDEGDVFVTRVGEDGQPIFSTMLAGAGTQRLVKMSLDSEGNVRVLLTTDAAMGVEIEGNPCRLIENFVSCDEPLEMGCLFRSPLDQSLSECGFCGDGVRNHPGEECDFADDSEPNCDENCQLVIDAEEEGDDIPSFPDLGGPAGPNSPFAPKSAAAGVLAGGATGSGPVIDDLVCMVAGHPTNSGLVEVVLDGDGGERLAAIVYPNLGTDGIWRYPEQPFRKEQYFIFGSTKETVNLGDRELKRNGRLKFDLVVGTYNLEDEAGPCIYLGSRKDNVVSDRFGKTNNEAAEIGGDVQDNVAHLNVQFEKAFSIGGVPIDPIADCRVSYALLTLDVGKLSVSANPPRACNAPAAASSLVAPAQTPAYAAEGPVTPDTPGALPLGDAYARSLERTRAVSMPYGTWWGGTLLGDVTFDTAAGPFEISANGDGTTAFVLLIDRDGTNIVSHAGFNGPGNQVVRAMLPTPTGDLLVAGDFENSIDFGSGPIQSRGGSDLFVARYSPEGKAELALSFGGPGDDTTTSISMGQFGDTIQLAGETAGGIDFGSGPLERGAFLVQLAPEGDALGCADVDEPCLVGYCDPVRGCVTSEVRDGVSCVDDGRSGECVAGICCFDGACAR